MTRGRVIAARLTADLLDTGEAAARRWLPDSGLAHRLGAAGRSARAAIPPRMAPLAAAVAKLRPSGTLLQVGSSGDPERAPLHQLIDAPGWRTVIVEPLPALFEALASAYAGRPAVHVENVALAPQDGERPFYYLTDASAGADGPRHPVGSLRRETILWRRGMLPDFDERFVETTVGGLTLASLLRRHGLARVDVLALDTDGEDAAILRQADLAAVQPLLIVMRTSALPPGVREAGLGLLRDHGYAMVEHGEDTWALAGAALTGPAGARLAAAWREVERGRDPREPLPLTRITRAASRRLTRPASRDREVVFPVSEVERRYLERGYDDSVPLPIGAAEHLSPENPRLAELRRAYARFDGPVTQHHLWRPEHVASRLTLPYFRGDDPYVWHYREHPRAMALTLAIYLRYLEDTAPPELLAAVTEDGAFGCWTTEISGYGRVSRDLLDSINELAFLDAQLGLRGRAGLRVLDIGAGYGRLAHRMTAAAPTVADYCCLDAVAESTFLAEYYLTHRGCMPPARVVALPDLDARLTPGSFDLAVNVHSFSECTLAAIEWWLDLIRRLEIPHLFVVPNEADGILSREADGDVRDALPAFAAAGYEPVNVEPAIRDARARALTRIHDKHWLFARRAGGP